MLHCFHSLSSPGCLKNDSEMKPKLSPVPACQDHNKAGQVLHLQTNKIQSESSSDLCFSVIVMGLALFQYMDMVYVLRTPNWTVINLSASQNLLGLTDVRLGYLFLIFSCYKYFWSNDSSVNSLEYLWDPLYKSHFANCH